MVAVIAVHAAGLWRAWEKKVPGARLHARIVGLFSLIAALPALLLAIAATTTFSRALDNWFNQQTMSIVQNSLNVAHAYLDEHGQVIRTDIVNMAKDLDDAAPAVATDARKFRELMLAQAGLRDLPVAYVVDAKGAVKVAVLEDEKIPYVAPPEHLIRAAESGQVPLLMPRDTFRVAALAKLRSYPDAYLYVARGVDPEVVKHLRRTEAGVRTYESLRQVRGGLKFAHGMMYFMISLTALLAAIWVGIWFAGLLRCPDPAADQRRPARDQGQPEGRAADPARRGRPAPPVHEFQHHDQGAGTPAHRPRHRQHPAHRTTPLHGGRAVRRVGRRHRPRSPRPHHARQPLGGEAAGPRRVEARRPPARRGGAGVRCHAEPSRGAQGPAATPGYPHHRRRGAQLLGARDARGEGRGGLRLGADLRRRHRAGLGAAHLGLGGRRPPHRPRDQEPADADTTFGRAPAPQVPAG